MELKGSKFEVIEMIIIIIIIFKRSLYHLMYLSHITNIYTVGIDKIYMDKNDH